MPLSAAGVLADTINDPGSTRTVYLLAAALTLLGIVLVVVTVWFWRSSRFDPEVLLPLEKMSSRAFRKSDGPAQQRMLDAARPKDAEPQGGATLRTPPSPEDVVDLNAISKAAVVSYDDLREPEPAVVADDTADAQRAAIDPLLRRFEQSEPTP
jgi:hypothetical protein